MQSMVATVFPMVCVHVRPRHLRMVQYIFDIFEWYIFDIYFVYIYIYILS